MVNAVPLTLHHPSSQSVLADAAGIYFGFAVCE